MILEEFELLLKSPEGANLEYKSAKNTFSHNDLIDYCAALANEGGGKLVLGVANDRKVVGTTVFNNTLNKIQMDLFQKLNLKILAEELDYQGRRVIIFHIPSRPVGQPVKSKGNYTYPMRVSESLVEMDTLTLKSILNENEPDFSNNCTFGLTIDDLDSQAIEKFKLLISIKNNRKEYRQVHNEQFLHDLGLMYDGKVTIAALVLLGKKYVIDQILPGAEIIFEWRQDIKKISYDFRTSWRDAFILIYDEIWEVIKARNIQIPLQQGFVQRIIWAYDEKSIREALLNAVAHRDYTNSNRSIFIKASPDAFYIESPGGFVPPVTVENILTKSVWRNRKLAESLEKAGLVERSGQGMDDIFENTIRDGKGTPDLLESDSATVKLTIPTKIEDPKFILFLEKVAEEKVLTFTVQDIYELETIRKSQVIKDITQKDRFLHLGIIEKHGIGKGAKYMLSHSYYQYEGRTGIHSRLIGTTREEKKLLIKNHLTRNHKGFMKDFRDLFPDIKVKDITNILQELKFKGEIRFNGSSNQGWWELVNQDRTLHSS